MTRSNSDAVCVKTHGISRKPQRRPPSFVGGEPAGCKSGDRGRSMGPLSRIEGGSLHARPSDADFFPWGDASCAAHRIEKAHVGLFTGDFDPLPLIRGVSAPDRGKGSSFPWPLVVLRERTPDDVRWFLFHRIRFVRNEDVGKAEQNREGIATRRCHERKHRSDQFHDTEDAYMDSCLATSLPIPTRRSDIVRKWDGCDHSTVTTGRNDFEGTCDIANETVHGMGRTLQFFHDTNVGLDLHGRREISEGRRPTTFPKPKLDEAWTFEPRRSRAKDSNGQT